MSIARDSGIPYTEGRGIIARKTRKEIIKLYPNRIVLSYASRGTSFP